MSEQEHYLKEAEVARQEISSCHRISRLIVGLLLQEYHRRPSASRSLGCASPAKSPGAWHLLNLGTCTNNLHQDC